MTQQTQPSPPKRNKYLWGALIVSLCLNLFAAGTAAIAAGGGHGFRGQGFKNSGFIREIFRALPRDAREDLKERMHRQRDTWQARKSAMHAQSLKDARRLVSLLEAPRFNETAVRKLLNDHAARRLKQGKNAVENASAALAAALAGLNAEERREVAEEVLEEVEEDASKSKRRDRRRNRK